MLKSRGTAFGSIRVRTPLAFPGQRIGLMGGSFNPPHEAHLGVGRTAMKRLGLDRVWWLVTPGNPLKSHDGLPPLASRLAACRALARSPREVVTGFENALGTGFTATTLAFLRRRHPGVRFVWIMGADALAGFHRWRHWRDIARTMPVVVVDRPGWRWRASAAPAARALAALRLPEHKARTLLRRRRRHGAQRWTLLSTRLSPLSSTELRRRS